MATIATLGGVKVFARHLPGPWTRSGSSVSQLMRSRRRWARREISCMSDSGASSAEATAARLQVPFSVSAISDARIIFAASPALEHFQEGHPESSSRVPAILAGLEKAGYTPEARPGEILRLDAYAPATAEHVAAVHSLQYVRGLEQLMSRAPLLLESSGPTYATSSTYGECMRSAGAGVSLVDCMAAAAAAGRSSPSGFALVRPPGHHAVPAGPMGFCVFNNVSIAARHAQRRGMRRVLIVDFDVHHGNGTNDAFYLDPDVLFISTHQSGSYPGTGKMADVGEGPGEGATINLPLPGGSGDEAMVLVMEEVIAPAALRFKPDIILVSAGYDAHLLDPLAGLQVTTSGFHNLARQIQQLAQQLCDGRCVFFLEGGYNLESLSASVVDTFGAFLGEKSRDRSSRAYLDDEPAVLVRDAVDQLRALHAL